MLQSENYCIIKPFSILLILSTMKNIIYLSFLLSPFFLSAQTISGILLDQATNRPVAYVNIGVQGKGLGTVSDGSGRFELEVPKTFDQDVLIFSIIGYETIEKRVQMMRNECYSGCQIRLKPTNYELKGIEVASHALKSVTVGIPNPTSQIQIGYVGDNLGYEAGTLMRIKRGGLVSKVRFHLHQCSSDSIFFRVNLYDKKGGLPNKNLLRKPVYVNCKCEDILEDFEVNLQEQNIYVEDDFFVTLEHIQQDSETGKLMFKGKLFKKGLFYRDTSQGIWKRMEFAAIGISAVLLQEK